MKRSSTSVYGKYPMTTNLGAGSSNLSGRASTVHRLRTLVVWTAAQSAQASPSARRSRLDRAKRRLEDVQARHAFRVCLVEQLLAQRHKRRAVPRITTPQGFNTRSSPPR